MSKVKLNNNKKQSVPQGNDVDNNKVAEPIVESESEDEKPKKICC